MVRERVNEGSSHTYRFQVVDENGAAVEFDALTLGTLTLFDMETGSADVSPSEGIINSRDAQDILPAGSPLILNDVTYEDDGYVRWDLQLEDNVIVNERRQIERHKAVFAFEWDGGAFTHQLEVEVVNVPHQ